MSIAIHYERIPTELDIITHLDTVSADYFCSARYGEILAERKGGIELDVQQSPMPDMTIISKDNSTSPLYVQDGMCREGIDSIRLMIPDTHLASIRIV